YAVVPGTAGASPGGDRAGAAQWRRKEPSGRNQRTDERSIHRGDHAVRVATERDADVERPDPVAGFDDKAEKDSVSKRFMWGQPPSAVQPAKPALALHDFNPGNQPTACRDHPWSRLF